MTTLKQLPSVSVSFAAGSTFDVQTTAEPLATQVDDVGGTVLYIGQALPESATSAAVWRIKKVTFTGSDVSVQWAGDGEFSLVWDDRLTYTYT
jgi:hypothetical protein